MKMIRRGRTGMIAALAVLLVAATACGNGEEQDTAADDPAESADEDDVVEEEEDEAAEEDDVAEEGDPDDFYAGETLEILVPFGPGGGMDTEMRFLSEFLSENIEGNPTVQVVNVEGGGGIIGSNEYSLNRDADGFSVLGSSGSNMFPFLLGDDAVQYSFTEMRPWLAYGMGAAVYTSSDTGIADGSELFTTDTDLVIGEQEPSGLAIPALLAWEILGLDVNVIMGYEGRGPARTALEQGETSLDWQNASSYFANVQPLVDEGSMVPLFTLGQLQGGEIVTDPNWPDLPTIRDLYVDEYGEEPSGELWEAYKVMISAGYTNQKVMWLHEDAPEAAHEALRAGGVALGEDDDMWAAGGDDILPYGLVTGDAVDDLVSDVLETDPAVLDAVRTFLNDNYDAGL